MGIYCLKKYDFKNKYIYSLDYYPEYLISKKKDIIFREENKQIINKKYYVATNPVKTYKYNDIFIDQYEYIVRRIIYVKILENIKLDEKYKFNQILTDINLLDIYSKYFNI